MQFYSATVQLCLLSQSSSKTPGLDSYRAYTTISTTRSKGNKQNPHLLVLLLRMVHSLLLQLLNRAMSLMTIRSDSLLAITRKLWLPMPLAVLLLLQRILLVFLIVLGGVWVIYLPVNIISPYSTSLFAR